jgi:hypothetical protein
MRRAFRAVLVAVCFGVFSLQSWSQQEVFVPGKDAAGYSVVPSEDSTEKAPSGYEGQTHKATQTATGNTPATEGKVFVIKITLGNEIKICPKADGTSEGDGEFSASVEYSDKQGNAGQIAMDAKAKYKGKVGDNALLDGPVKADIDYTFSRSGSFPDKSGAIFSPPAVHVLQHVTMDVTVAMGMNGGPGLSGFGVSDVTQDKISNAFDAAAAVAYWGGVYYGIAETEWTQGYCVHVVFDPPSNTVKAAPGTQVKVKAQVQTKAGETTKAHLVNARAYHGANVDPGEGVSDVGAPMTFTFTAPQKAPSDGSKPSFEVDVVSRAGGTDMRNPGEWEAGLGKDWGGQITYSYTYSGDEGQDELQTWSSSMTTFFTVAVKDGVADASEHAEENIFRANRHKALQGGTVVVLPAGSDTIQGSADGYSKGRVRVDIDTDNKDNKTYSISPELGPFPPGKLHTETCGPEKCDTKDLPFNLAPAYPGLPGWAALDDPNHVHGTKTTVTKGLGRSRNGTRTETVTWDLAREGAKQ